MVCASHQRYYAGSAATWTNLDLAAARFNAIDFRLEYAGGI
jgi:hypothetical protein